MTVPLPVMPMPKLTINKSPVTYSNVVPSVIKALRLGDELLKFLT